MDRDDFFINRCFSLALMGAGNVSPNPMVGAVIVSNGKIIGEGYHRKYGFAHAEVNAVASVQDKNLLKGSTVYVSLEPCSHYGKTPPCAKLLVECQIKRCVIANTDPNPKVSGNGIKILKDAGIDVVCGVQERKGRYINRRFFCYQEKKRPYIILKFAQSKDGYMDINAENQTLNREKYWISNDAMNVYVHKMRTENDSFLVGANTVINDNCCLNTRYVYGRNPIRLVYDKDLSIPKNRHFFDDTQRTVIFNNLKDEIVSPNTQYIKIKDEYNAEQEILQALYNIGVSSLVIEGGKKTLLRFIEKNLWDEALVITSDKCFHKGLPVPIIDTRFKAATDQIADNKLEIYFNENAF